MMLIVGAGVAGLSCAIAAARAGVEATLVTPGVLWPSADAGLAALAGGNTAMAQGGIAAAVGDDDTAADHAADTVAAGAGLVDPRAAHVLTAEGAEAMRAMLAGGFPADRDASGRLSLGLEAAHRRARIVHAGEDRTGAALHAFLAREALEFVRRGLIRLTERTSLDSLLTDSGAVSGAVLRDAAGHRVTVRAGAVVLATGGYAALYPRTSNHARARGEGIVQAAHAGAVVADLEFVQFHPTVLAGTGFLISEAVRGAGAVLRDGSGERFMTAVHAAAELAPRDVVARTMHRVLRQRGEGAVWLDATGIEAAGGNGTLARRFPSITAATRAQGFDWTREPVPVAPAAHYTMGGVATDLEARTTVPGLFAAGEVTVDEAMLWKSYNSLSMLVYPATSESIRIAEQIDEDQRNRAERDSGGKRFPAATECQKQLRRVVLWLAGILLFFIFFQSYVILLSDVLRGLEQHNAALASLESQINELKTLKPEMKDADSPMRGQIERQTNLTSKVIASFDMLSQLSWPWQWLYHSPDFTKGKIDVRAAHLERIAVEQASKSVLQVLNYYLLPLVLGLLGAVAFIVRRLLRSLASTSYTLNSGRRYGMRLALGALLGVISGIFIAPDQPQLQPFNLPLVVLAFLMGYSVEFAFSAFDAIIERGRQAVSSTEPSTDAKIKTNQDHA